MASDESAKWKWKTTGDLWPALKPRARQMRSVATPAEDQLWERLRSRRLLGARFRRQHSIARFIVDFYCAEARLVVEVDGPIHDDQRDEDAHRQAILESQGFQVIRFTNAMILEEIHLVLAKIRSALETGSRQEP